MWLIRELMTAWRSVFTVAQWKKAGQCGWYQPWERRVLLSVSLIFWLWATGYYQDQNSSPSLNLVLSLMPWKSNNQWLHDIFHQTLLPPGNYSSSKIVKNRGGKKKKKRWHRSSFIENWRALSALQIISPFAPSHWQLLWVTFFIQVSVYVKVTHSLPTSRPVLSCLTPKGTFKDFSESSKGFHCGPYLPSFCILFPRRKAFGLPTQSYTVTLVFCPLG